jgi:hypothetical protein
LNYIDFSELKVSAVNDSSDLEPFRTERPDHVPGRVLLDTCILNRLHDEGGYIFEGEIDQDEDEISDDSRALRAIFTVNERAHFELLISPLTVAEVANAKDFVDRERRVRWVLDVLDHWLIMLDESGDRVTDGGSVRHRFKLTPELQAVEAELMKIPDFRRDPFDQLLLVQYRMGVCDAFLTTDRNTIWKHRSQLTGLGIRVLTPTEYWELLRPRAALWL